MTIHSVRATTALTALAETDPALAALSLWCDHRDGDATQTRDTTITYGPEFVDLTRPEQIGLAAHHILHVALRHSARMAGLQYRLGAGFDAALWQLCADAIVNQALLLADHALPRPAVTLTGLLDSLGDPAGSAETALADWDSDRLYFRLTASGNGKAEAEAARAYARQQALADDITPSNGTNGTEPDQNSAVAWSQHLSRAMQTGRQAGRGLGLIGHIIADIPAPRTPWELILRRLLASAVMIGPQTAPHRPSRRWIATAAQAQRQGARLPGFQPGQRPLTDVPRIAVAIDASGSIDDARLSLFWTEVLGIARRLRAELHVLVFDDDIRSAQRVDPSAMTVTLPDMPRGGGTDFQPVIRAALALNAAALVVLTDLDGPTGPPPKRLSVIWAVPQAADQMPPFGRLIDLSA
ncbi:VWA-like domain-containing protein [Loktanella sp. SALINAS62]|uniref:vWA domain-containing protein n=1 Tax=Loktanella sp. SALINAS62 TaxID=2706124 RepID=UPI001B8BC556|nr:hypothetical protein [Loktanella sp. SALINAS62]